MHKIALVLALAAIGEGALALHLVRQLHEERDNAQKLQARVTELESKAPPQPGASATFIAVPQPTVSPFTGQQVNAPPSTAASGRTVRSGNVALSSSFGPVPPADREQMRQQMEANMERQRTMLRDPEYRDAMLAQQKMGLMRSSPNLGRDLDLTGEQVDRLFDTLAEQQLRSMEISRPLPWGEQQDPAQMQEYHRQLVEQQSANEAEIKRALGEAKFREWQEYQSMAGVRWEADRVRSSLASAGLPLDDNLSKPLLKTLAAQQQKMMEEAARLAVPATNSLLPVGGGWSSVVTSDATQTNVLQMQEKALELTAQRQKQQREALARVLTTEQLKVVEDEHTAELQMQKAQLRMMRVQQEAGVAPGGGNIGYIQEGVSVNFAPATSN